MDGMVLGLALLKIFSTGKAIYDAGTDKGILGDDQRKAWLELIDTTIAATKALHPSATSAGVSLGISSAVAAFGQAFSEHWANSETMAPWQRPRMWIASLSEAPSTRLRRARIGLSLRNAIANSASSSPDVELWLSAKADPCAHPIYKELWAQFTSPLSETEWTALSMVERDLPRPDRFPDAPLLALSQGEPARFEHRYRSHLAQILSQHGTNLTDLAAQAKSDAQQLLLRLSLSEMAQWRGKIAVGGGSTGIPELTLEELYIEPNAVPAIKTAATEGKPPPTAILTTLRTQLDAPESRVTVILGDFGLGKSMTARTFAAELAQRQLESLDPAHARWYPIFVKCAESLERAISIDELVRRGIHSTLRESGLNISLADPALDGAPQFERCAVILDGLDERALSESELESLFKALDDRGSPSLKFFVFTRPALLSNKIRTLAGVSLFELQPFTLSTQNAPSQVDEWLERWNSLVRDGKPAISKLNLVNANLDTIATTPVVLFVIGYVWDDIPPERSASRTQLYERFFTRVARGKLPETGHAHPVIAAAADSLMQHLAREHLHDTTDPVDALLWTLSRVAWEAHRLEQMESRRELTRRALESLFTTALEVPESDGEYFDLVRDGIMLSLQHDSSASGTRILYGHKSFREFLVARYWFTQMVRAETENDDRVFNTLLGGRLDVWQDASRSFLLELLATQPEATLFSMRERCGRILRADTVDSDGLRADQQSDLRHSVSAVLALIGRVLHDRNINPPRHVIRRSSILTILGSQIAKGRPNTRLWLNHARIEDLALSSASHEIYLFGDFADFARCAFRTSLNQAWLCNARFSNCTLANLLLCDLDGAQLVDCILTSLFFHCSLKGTIFDRCDVSTSTFRDCEIDLSSFATTTALSRILGNPRASAVHTGVSFHDCELSGSLDGRDLRGCTFADCDLTKVTFRDANIADVSFEGSRLDLSSLKEALFFERALLEGACIV